jgi:hypothetical protein
MEEIIVIVFDTEQASHQAVKNRKQYSSFTIRQAGTHVMRDHDHALAGHGLGASDELRPSTGEERHR